MIKRTFVVFGWLTVGHAIGFALYWLLLQVPESNILMLGTSLVLVLALAWWLAFVQAVSLLASASPEPLRGKLRPAVGRTWMAIGPLFVFLLVWFLAARAYMWMSAHGSEVDAWIIVKTGWTKANRIEPVLRHALVFVHWGVGLSLAITLYWAQLRRGLGACFSTTWLMAALHWRVLLTFAVALVVAVLLPSHLVDWHWLPEGRAGTWFEPAFAAVKIGVIYMWGNLVWAIVLRVVARHS